VAYSWSGVKTGYKRGNFFLTVKAIRASIIFLGAVITAMIAGATPWNNILWQNSPLGGGHFPLVSFLLLVLATVLWNPLMGRLFRSFRLLPGEILLLWTVSAIASTLSYTGFARTFLANITTPGRMLAEGTLSAKEWLFTLPVALFPRDPVLIKSVLYGNEGCIGRTVFEVLGIIPWNKWIVPIALWLLFFGCVCLAIFGIVGLFSHQWIENERMNFPLLQVPILFAEQSIKGTLGTHLRSPYFIIGLLIPVLLHTLNGLSTYYPHVPNIPTLLLAQPYVPKGGILKGFYKAKIYLYPAFIGFAYLTVRQVSFSLWFFFVLGGLLPGVLSVAGLRIPEVALGTTFGPVLSRVEEMQAVGAYGIFFLFLVWLAREHLVIALKSVGIFFQRQDRFKDFSGLTSPSVSLFLLLVGFIGAVAWCVYFKMPLYSTVPFFLLCFIIQLVSARLVCQAGLPYYTLTVAPSDGFLTFLPSNLLSPLMVYLGAVLQKLAFVDYRESLIPTLFHAYALGENSGARKRFLIGIVIALVVTLLFSTMSMLVLYYKYGMLSLPDAWALETVTRVHEQALQLIQHPEAPKKWSILFATAGAVVMTLIILGYRRFLWWPLHPVGYLLAYSSAMKILWFSFFVGWLCNTVVLRYGGVRMYRTVRWFFIGLIVGDTVMAVFWLIVGLFSPVSYHVFPL